MTTHRFSVGTQLKFNGRPYEVVRYTPENGQLVTLEDPYGVYVTEPLDKLVTALFTGTLEFISKLRNAKKRDTDNLPNPEELTISLDDYPEKLVEIARFRLKVILPLMQPDKNRTMKMCVDRATEMANEGKALGQNLNYRSLYRWIADYKKSGDVRCLIPNTRKRGAPQTPRLSDEVLTIVDGVIKAKLRREKSSVKGILTIIAAEIEKENSLRGASKKLAVPSLSTIQRRIDGLDLKQYLEAKKGKRKAAQMLRQTGKTPYPELPLERVEFDHTKTDLIVIDEDDFLPLGRCTISFLLDMATRYPLGYYLGFEPPSYYTVAESLYHAISPKPSTKALYGTENEWIAYGIPLTLVVDQGREFIGKDLEDACELLGIVLDVSPVKTPEFKGGIERNFGSLNNGLFHQIPGTTFSNFLEKADYDSRKAACVSLTELEAALNKYIVDDFSQRFHSGLGGIPAKRWQGALNTNFFPRLPPDNDTLRILLGRVDYRKIQHYGIDFECIQYNCNDLAYLRLKKAGESVKIKYHPGDLSRIHVFNEFDNEYIEVPAIDQEYTKNLSLWKHNVIRRFGKVNGDKEDLAALGRAKIKIQDIVDQAKSQKKIVNRARVGRWDRGGKPASLTDKKNSNQVALPKPQEVKVATKKNEEPEITDFSGDLAGWEVIKGVPANERQ